MVVMIMARSVSRRPMRRASPGKPSSPPVLLRLPAPDARYAAVRLRSDLTSREFARDDGEWRLELDDLPPVERLEYQLEVEHDDGGTESLLDPGNPHTVAGAFGDKSVLLLSTDPPPAWLGQPPAEGAGL